MAESSFVYIGPKFETEDRDCARCATVARGRCLEHPIAPEEGCAFCQVVALKRCPSHCGVEAALKGSGYDPESVAFVMSKLDNLPDGVIDVHARQSEPSEEGELYSIAVEIKLRPY